MMKNKFVLEFDEEPALVFVQKKTSAGIRDAELYQDGEAVRGWRELTIRAAIHDITTHEVEYITGQTKAK
jgi:hypothetical protein